MVWNDNGITIFFGEQMFGVSPSAALIFFAAFLFFLLTGFFFLKYLGSEKGRICRWERVPKNNRPPFTKWHCASCHMDAYTNDNRPPKECKKHLKSVM